MITICSEVSLFLAANLDTSNLITSLPFNNLISIANCVDGLCLKINLNIMLLSIKGADIDIDCCGGTRQQLKVISEEGRESSDSELDGVSLKLDDSASGINNKRCLFCCRRLFLWTRVELFRDESSVVSGGDLGLIAVLEEAHVVRISNDIRSASVSNCTEISTFRFRLNDL